MSHRYCKQRSFYFNHNRIYKSALTGGNSTNQRPQEMCTFRRKLFYGINKSKIFAAWDEHLMFKFYCQYAYQQNIISDIVMSDLIEIYEKDQILAKNKLLYIFSCRDMQDFYDISNKVKEIPSRNLANQAKDYKNLWKIFINVVKDLRKNDGFIVPIDQLQGKIFLSIEEINLDIPLSRMIKQTAFDNINIISKYTFTNLYEIFFEKYRKILVIGNSGMGKSIHIQYIIYQWATNRWITDNDYLIIRLNLKDFNKGNDISSEILRQNFKHLEFMNRDTVELLLKEEEENIILCIDGYDDFHSDSPRVQYIIDCQKPTFKTMIMCREMKASEIKKTADAIFKLNRIPHCKLMNLFRNFSKNDASGYLILLNDMLKKYGLLQSICQIPILAVRVYIFFQTEELNIDMTAYDFFDKFIKHLYKIVNVTEKQLANKHLTNFYKLCLLNLSKEKIVCKKKLILKIAVIFKSLLTIDVYKADENKLQIQFHDKSFQEFFAAKYIIHLFGKNNFTELNEILNKVFNAPKTSRFSNIYILNNVFNFISEYDRLLGKNLLRKYNIILKMIDQRSLIYDYLICNENLAWLDFQLEEHSLKIVQLSINGNQIFDRINFELLKSQLPNLKVLNIYLTEIWFKMKTKSFDQFLYHLNGTKTYESVYFRIGGLKGFCLKKFVANKNDRVDIYFEIKKIKENFQFISHLNILSHISKFVYNVENNDQMVDILWNINNKGIKCETLKLYISEKFCKFYNDKEAIKILANPTLNTEKIDLNFQDYRVGFERKISSVNYQFIDQLDWPRFKPFIETEEDFSIKPYRRRTSLFFPDQSTLYQTIERLTVYT